MSEMLELRKWSLDRHCGCRLLVFSLFFFFGELVNSLFFVKMPMIV